METHYIFAHFSFRFDLIFNEYQTKEFKAKSNTYRLYTINSMSKTSTGVGEHGGNYLFGGASEKPALKYT